MLYSDKHYWAARARRFFPDGPAPGNWYPRQHLNLFVRRSLDRASPTKPAHPFTARQPYRNGYRGDRR